MRIGRMRILLVTVVIANLLLLGWFQGWMAPLGVAGREPDRRAREVMPDRLRLVPVEGPSAASSDGASEGASEGSGPGAAPGSPVEAGGAPPTLPMPPEAPASSALDADRAGPPWARMGCVELGLLTEAQAMSVQASLVGQAVAISMLQPFAHETWWVYLLPSTPEGAALPETLRARGLADGAVLMREGALRGAIVLGRYREVGNALAMQRRLILAGFPDTRLAARGGPPGTTVLRVQGADAPSLLLAAQTGSGPLRLEPRPFSEALTELLERQRDALRTAASPIALNACPPDQTAVFSSRR